MVVLDPGEVPDEPADRVGARRRRGHERVGVEAVDGLVDVLGDAAEQFVEQGGDVHAIRSSSSVRWCGPA